MKRLNSPIPAHACRTSTRPGQGQPPPGKRSSRSAYSLGMQVDETCTAPFALQRTAEEKQRIERSDHGVGRSRSRCKSCLSCENKKKPVLATGTVIIYSHHGPGQALSLKKESGRPTPAPLTRARPTSPDGTSQLSVLRECRRRCQRSARMRRDSRALKTFFCVHPASRIGCALRVRVTVERYEPLRRFKPAARFSHPIPSARH